MLGGYEETAVSGVFRIEKIGFDNVGAAILNVEKWKHGFPFGLPSSKVPSGPSFLCLKLPVYLRRLCRLIWLWHAYYGYWML